MKRFALLLTLATLPVIQPAADAQIVQTVATSPAHVQTVAVRRPVRRRVVRRRVIVRRRPASHSAAIIGGSAAGGAAIGALAGGGKGAAIGALAGGASGLVYDRATHKKRVVVRR